MTTRAFGSLSIACLILTGSAALAEAQGPVAAACEADIPKYCAGLSHGQGAIRNCLETNKDKVSVGCKAALEATGPGKGLGAGSNGAAGN